ILYTRRPERDAQAAIAMAIELKRRWLLSEFNQKRRGKSFYDVGVGLHFGPIMLRRHPSAEGVGRSFNAEGYAISLAKRIEGYARNGRLSKIMLSKRMSDLADLSTIKVSERRDAPLTGIYGSAAVHELEVHGDIEDPERAAHIRPEEIDAYVAALESSG